MRASNEMNRANIVAALVERYNNIKIESAANKNVSCVKIKIERMLPVTCF
jgi:hypothetical protein